MEGEKERERERGEEKESDDMEDGTEGAALLWEKSYPEDELGLPIMHWEALGLRIEELEKQEEERREKEVGFKPMFQMFKLLCSSIINNIF